MSTANTPVTVHILDKEYLIACPEDEHQALQESARYLDMKMREIRNTGKIVGIDRIAVMAALNIANDFLQKRSQGQSLDLSLATRLQSLQEHIDQAISQNQQMEL